MNCISCKHSERQLQHKPVVRQYLTCNCKKSEQYGKEVKVKCEWWAK